MAATKNASVVQNMERRETWATREASEAEIRDLERITPRTIVAPADFLLKLARS